MRLKMFLVICIIGTRARRPSLFNPSWPTVTCEFTIFLSLCSVTSRREDPIVTWNTAPRGPGTLFTVVFIDLAWETANNYQILPKILVEENQKRSRPRLKYSVFKNIAKILNKIHFWLSNFKHEYWTWSWNASISSSLEI